MWQLKLLLLCLVCWTVATNSTLPSISLTTDPPPTHNGCVKECLYVLIRSNHQADYHQCMNSCLGEWPLSYGGDYYYDIPHIDPNSGTCDPKQGDIGVTELRYVDPTTNETFGYLAVSWTPCPAGIEAVTGFRVCWQQASVGAFPNCQRLILTRNLTTQDINTPFSVIMLPKAANSAQYDLELRSLPMAKFAYVSYPVQTLSPPVAAPKVFISGYRVVVTTYPRTECHRITFYEFVIASSQPSKTLYSKIARVNGDEKEVSKTFDKVYDSPAALAVYVVTRAYGDVWKTKNAALSVNAWIPPLPNVTIHSRNHIEVFFSLAPENFTVSMYSLRLSKHVAQSNDSHSGEFNETHAVKVISITDLNQLLAKKGVLSKKYLQLPPGTYSVQIRESRSESKYFNLPKWGKRRYFVVEPPAISLAIVIIPVILCIAIIAVVSLLVMWKRNRCRRIRYAFPPGIVSLLDTQAVTMATKTIFLVWQTDFRSRKLSSLQADVVRHLAAYLGSVCSLDVVVDIFNETEASRSMSGWTRNALKKCDFVLFLCPHFDYNSSPKVVHSALGDFHTVYSYLERDLTNREKFITALLPYSDRSLSSSELLIRMSRVFYLMDDISDLFFHIQGIPRAEVSGVHNAQFINAEEYKETRDGAALARGLAIFQEALSSWTENSSSLDSSEKSEDSKEGCSVFFLADGSEKSLLGNESPKTSRINVLPPVPTSNDDDDNDAPLMVRSLRGVVRPPSPNSLINQRTEHIHPPSAFVSDPDLAIHQINNPKLELDSRGKTNTPFLNLTGFDAKTVVASSPNSSEPRSNAEGHCSSQSQEETKALLEKRDFQSLKLTGNHAVDLQPSKPQSGNRPADSGFNSLAV